ncbi:ribonuclease H-like protein [Phlegmacium glaucopus]|nr:ribonuclease H-like protein [Phlegmacium glaucopus]
MPPKPDRKHALDSEYVLASKKRRLAPAASFADVLGDLAKISGCLLLHYRYLSFLGEQENACQPRPQPPRLKKDRDSITFQKLDIRESQNTSGESEIQLIGVTRGGHSILVHVLDFQHYFYYPSPRDFTKDDLQSFRKYLNWLTDLETESIAVTPNGPLDTFLKFIVSDHSKVRQLRDDPFLRVFTSGRCQYRDLFSDPQSSYEGKVPYHLRFMIDNEIECMSWLKIPSGKYDLVSANSKVSTCQLEVTTSCEDLLVCDTVDNRQKYAPLRILSFDLECNVPAGGNQFPNACNDPIFQIASMVSYHGQSAPFIRTVFTVGSCAPIAGTEVKSLDTEADMLQAWQEFFTKVDPDVVIGYNITQFDIPFLLKRASILGLDTFPFLGRIKSSSQRVGPNPPGGWRSTAENCPGYDGRLLLDLLQHIQGHYPGRNRGGYKLDAVSLDFLGQRKENIHFSQISVLQNGDAETRRDLAVYCLKDTYLPLLLLDKLKCLEKEVEACREAHVPFNAMRVDPGLKHLSKKCKAAVEEGYVVVDH